MLRIWDEKIPDLQIESNLLLNHVSLRIPGFHKRMEGTTGNLRIRGRSLNAVVDRAKIGSTEFSGTVVVTDFDNPKVEIVLESPFVDTTDFTSPLGYVSNVTWGEWIRANSAARFWHEVEAGLTSKSLRAKHQVELFRIFTLILRGQMGWSRCQNGR